MNHKFKASYWFLVLALLGACSQRSSNEGDALFEAGKYEQAVSVYTSILENDPKNIRALYHRGRAYEELGQLEAAESDFKSAYGEDQKNTQVLLGLSNLYQKMQQHEMSLQYANYAVELSGAPPTAYFLRGRAYHQLGNTGDALKDYDMAIDMNPDYGQAFYYRGMLKLNLKRNAAACADLEKAVALDHKQAREASATYCD